MNVLRNSELLDTIKTQGGFTLVKHGKDWRKQTSGYMVAISGYEVKIAYEDLTENVVVAIVTGLSQISPSNMPYEFSVGAWHNEENGVVYFDLSVNFAIESVAIEFGKENNQLAIFCLDTFETITL